MIEANYPVPKAPWEYTATSAPSLSEALTVPELAVGDPYDPSYQSLFDKLKPTAELKPGGTIYV